MKKFYKDQSPFLIHSYKNGLNEYIYVYGITFWHEPYAFIMFPEDIIKELGEHSNTADFPACKNVQIRYLCKVGNTFFTKEKPKNIPDDFELYMYSAMQVVRDEEEDNAI